MNKTRNMVAAGALALAMGITSLTVFAAAKYDTPEEALSGITGKSVEEITEERFEEGKTFGEIAAEAGKLDEFKEELLEQKKEILEERVAEGAISREAADEMLERMEENQGTCIGNGRQGSRMMGGFGFRFGGGRGNGFGRNR